MFGRKKYKNEQFFSAIGRLVIAWSWLEEAMDIAVFVIYLKYHDGKPEEESPIPFKKKIKFLRRAVEEMQDLAELKDRILDLLSRIENELGHRHDIIHGAVKNAPRDIINKTQIIRTRLNCLKDFNVREVEITTEGVLERYSVVWKLADQFGAINDDLMKKFGI